MGAFAKAFAVAVLFAGSQLYGCGGTSDSSDDDTVAGPATEI